MLQVHIPALNHIGLWVDDIKAAHEYLLSRGVRFTPGGIRKGAGDNQYHAYSVCLCMMYACPAIYIYHVIYMQFIHCFLKSMFSLISVIYLLSAGHDVCFIHPKGNDTFPIGSEGVLLELVQAPPNVIAAYTAK